MDSSSQLTIAYDMLYYIKFTALSIKIFLQDSTSFSFADISRLVRDAIIKFSI